MNHGVTPLWFAEVAPPLRQPPRRRAAMSPRQLPRLPAQHVRRLDQVQSSARGWSVADVGSTNGTYLGDADEPLEVDQPVALENGAFVRIGAWTRLTLTARVEH